MLLSAAKASILVELRTKKGREKHQAFLVTGVRSLSEMLDAGWQPDYYLVSRPSLTETGKNFLNKLPPDHIFETTEKTMRKIDSSSTSQGIAAFVLLHSGRRHSNRAECSLMLALDGISDPSNLGSIFRSAHAFGFHKTLLGSGCCEAYSPKVISSSAGMQFHLEIVDNVDLVNVLPEYTAKGFKILGTDPEGVDLGREMSGTGSICLVIGNEAHGVSPVVQSVCDEMVRVPMAEECESLSAPVAAAISMYELSRLVHDSMLGRNNR
jgi:TrmH family RNA methyltransferase